MLLLFFGSNGAQKKSVKLKKHKQKKWNIFRISVKEIEREKKIERNELPTFNPQFTHSSLKELLRSFIFSGNP